MRPDRYRYPQRAARSFGEYRGTLFICAFVLAIVGGLWWFFVGFWADANARFWKWFTQVFLERWFFPDGPNPLHFTWFFWLCAAIVLVVIAFGLSESGGRVGVAGVAAIVACVLFFVVLFSNINDNSAKYAGATTFIVEDIDRTPSSLKRLVDDTEPNRNGCALYAHNDMRGCINQGSFQFEWQARVASLTSAEFVIRRSSGGVSNTKLLEDTLSYIYGEGEKGEWTAIRDGKNRQPVYGVASWPGEGNVQTCTFTGQYSMNKAFGGKWGKNLSDEIAGKYRQLFFDDEDRYGYCKGDQPVIVIPVKEQEAFRTRTRFKSAGVLVITGSPSGDARYKHVTNVKPGDFPGPVYPSSLAKEQRESMGMIAGIWDSWTGNFGYQPTDAPTQSGNASEYQLRDKSTGRVYWVTPMKPRSSDDQVLAAYSVIPADEATSGSLNQQRIFVLPDGDPRTVNIDDLEARTRQAVSETDPGFFAADGRLAEFLPLSGEEWQVYAELSGRVVYRITVPTDSRIKPTVLRLDETAAPPEQEDVPEQASACREDLSKLSDKVLAECLADIADELNGRQVKQPK